MALKKTYGSKIVNGIEVEPQRDIDMHPIEEAATLAHWAIHDEVIKIPLKPSQDQEHEWMIEFGSSYVKEKRQEWQRIYEEKILSVEKAKHIFKEAEKAWNDHADICIKNNLDPDTFIGDARLSLKIPK